MASEIGIAETISITKTEQEGYLSKQSSKTVDEVSLKELERIKSELNQPPDNIQHLPERECLQEGSEGVSFLGSTSATNIACDETSRAAEHYQALEESNLIEPEMSENSKVFETIEKEKEHDGIDDKETIIQKAKTESPDLKVVEEETSGITVETNIGKEASLHASDSTAGSLNEEVEKVTDIYNKEVNMENVSSKDIPFIQTELVETNVWVKEQGSEKASNSAGEERDPEAIIQSEKAGDEKQKTTYDSTENASVSTIDASSDIQNNNEASLEFGENVEEKLGRQSSTLVTGKVGVQEAELEGLKTREDTNFVWDTESRDTGIPSEQTKDQMSLQIEENPEIISVVSEIKSEDISKESPLEQTEPFQEAARNDSITRTKGVEYEYPEDKLDSSFLEQDGVQGKDKDMGVIEVSEIMASENIDTSEIIGVAEHDKMEDFKHSFVQQNEAKEKLQQSLDMVSEDNEKTSSSENVESFPSIIEEKPIKTLEENLEEKEKENQRTTSYDITEEIDADDKHQSAEVECSNKNVGDIHVQCPLVDETIQGESENLDNISKFEQEQVQELDGAPMKEDHNIGNKLEANQTTQNTELEQTSPEGAAPMELNTRTSENTEALDSKENLDGRSAESIKETKEEEPCNQERSEIKTKGEDNVGTISEEDPLVIPQSTECMEKGNTELSSQKAVEGMEQELNSEGKGCEPKEDDKNSIEDMKVHPKIPDREEVIITGNIISTDPIKEERMDSHENETIKGEGSNEQSIIESYPKDLSLDFVGDDQLKDIQDNKKEEENSIEEMETAGAVESLQNQISQDNETPQMICDNTMVKQEESLQAASVNMAPMQAMTDTKYLDDALNLLHNSPQIDADKNQSADVELSNNSFADTPVSHPLVDDTIQVESKNVDYISKFEPEEQVQELNGASTEEDENIESTLVANQNTELEKTCPERAAPKELNTTACENTEALDCKENLDGKGAGNVKETNEEEACNSERCETETKGKANDNMEYASAIAQSAECTVNEKVELTSLTEVEETEQVLNGEGKGCELKEDVESNIIDAKVYPKISDSKEVIKEQNIEGDAISPETSKEEKMDSQENEDREEDTNRHGITESNRTNLYVDFVGDDQLMEAENSTAEVNTKIEETEEITNEQTIDSNVISPDIIKEEKMDSQDNEKDQGEGTDEQSITESCPRDLSLDVVGDDLKEAENSTTEIHPKVADKEEVTNEQTIEGNVISPKPIKEEKMDFQENENVEEEDTNEHSITESYPRDITLDSVGDDKLNEEENSTTEVHPKIADTEEVTNEQTIEGRVISPEPIEAEKIDSRENEHEGGEDTNVHSITESYSRDLSIDSIGDDQLKEGESSAAQVQPKIVDIEEVTNERTIEANVISPEPIKEEKMDSQEIEKEEGEDTNEHSITESYSRDLSLDSVGDYQLKETENSTTKEHPQIADKEVTNEQTIEGNVISPEPIKEELDSRENETEEGEDTNEHSITESYPRDLSLDSVGDDHLKEAENSTAQVQPKIVDTEEVTNEQTIEGNVISPEPIKEEKLDLREIEMEGEETNEDSITESYPRDLSLDSVGDDHLEEAENSTAQVQSKIVETEEVTNEQTIEGNVISPEPIKEEKLDSRENETEDGEDTNEHSIIESYPRDLSLDSVGDDHLEEAENSTAQVQTKIVDTEEVTNEQTIEGIVISPEPIKEEKLDSRENEKEEGEETNEHSITESYSRDFSLDSIGDYQLKEAMNSTTEEHPKIADIEEVTNEQTTEGSVISPEPITEEKIDSRENEKEGEDTKEQSTTESYPRDLSLDAVGDDQLKEAENSTTKVHPKIADEEEITNERTIECNVITPESIEGEDTNEQSITESYPRELSLDSVEDYQLKEAKISTSEVHPKIADTEEVFKEIIIEGSFITPEPTKEEKMGSQDNEKEEGEDTNEKSMTESNPRDISLDVVGDDQLKQTDNSTAEVHPKIADTELVANEQTIEGNVISPEPIKEEKLDSRENEKEEGEDANEHSIIESYPRDISLDVVGDDQLKEAELHSKFKDTEEITNKQIFEDNVISPEPIKEEKMDSQEIVKEEGEEANEQSVKESYTRDLSLDYVGDYQLKEADNSTAEVHLKIADTELVDNEQTIEGNVISPEPIKEEKLDSRENEKEEGEDANEHSIIESYPRDISLDVVGDDQFKEAENSIAELHSQFEDTEEVTNEQTIEDNVFSPEPIKEEKMDSQENVKGEGEDANEQSMKESYTKDLSLDYVGDDQLKEAEKSTAEVHPKITDTELVTNKQTIEGNVISPESNKEEEMDSRENENEEGEDTNEYSITKSYPKDFCQDVVEDDQLKEAEVHPKIADTEEVSNEQIVEAIVISPEPIKEEKMDFRENEKGEGGDTNEHNITESYPRDLSLEEHGIKDFFPESIEMETTQENCREDQACEGLETAASSMIVEKENIVIEAIPELSPLVGEETAKDKSKDDENNMVNLKEETENTDSKIIEQIKATTPTEATDTETSEDRTNRDLDIHELEDSAFSSKGGPDIEKAADEMEERALIPELDSKNPTKENFQPTKPDEKLECTSKLLAEGESNEILPETDDSHNEENSYIVEGHNWKFVEEQIIRQQFQEGNRETEEDIKPKYELQDHIDSTENQKENIVEIVCSDEVQRGVDKQDESQNNKGKVIEVENNEKDHTVSLDVDTVDKGEVSDLISTQYLKILDTEQKEPGNSAKQSIIMKDQEASDVTTNQGVYDTSLTSEVQGVRENDDTESEQKLDIEKLDADEDNVSTETPEPSLGEPQFVNKPVDAFTISTKVVMETSETTEASLHSCEVDSMKPEETTQDSASQLSTFDQDKTDKECIFVEDPEADEVNRSHEVSDTLFKYEDHIVKETDADEAGSTVRTEISEKNLEDPKMDDKPTEVFPNTTYDRDLETIEEVDSMKLEETSPDLVSQLTNFDNKKEEEKSVAMEDPDMSGDCGIQETDEKLTQEKHDADDDGTSLITATPEISLGDLRMDDKPLEDFLVTTDEKALETIATTEANLHGDEVHSTKLEDTNSNTVTQLSAINHHKTEEESVSAEDPEVHEGSRNQGVSDIFSLSENCSVRKTDVTEAGKDQTAEKLDPEKDDTIVSRETPEIDLGEVQQDDNPVDNFNTTSNDRVLETVEISEPHLRSEVDSLKPEGTSSDSLSQLPTIELENAKKGGVIVEITNAESSNQGDEENDESRKSITPGKICVIETSEMLTAVAAETNCGVAQIDDQPVQDVTVPSDERSLQAVETTEAILPGKEVDTASQIPTVDGEKAKRDTAEVPDANEVEETEIFSDVVFVSRDEASEENGKSRVVKRLDEDEASEVTAATTIETSTVEAQPDEKPEKAFSSNLDEKGLKGIEMTEASLQGEEIDCMKLEETTSDRVYQPPSTNHGNAEEGIVAVDEDRVEESKLYSNATFESNNQSGEIDETEKSHAARTLDADGSSESVTAAGASLEDNQLDDKLQKALTTSTDERSLEIIGTAEASLSGEGDSKMINEETTTNLVSQFQTIGRENAEKESITDGTRDADIVEETKISSYAANQFKDQKGEETGKSLIMEKLNPDETSPTVTLITEEAGLEKGGQSQIKAITSTPDERIVETIEVPQNEVESLKLQDISSNTSSNDRKDAEEVKETKQRSDEVLESGGGLKGTDEIDESLDGEMLYAGNIENEIAAEQIPTVEKSEEQLQTSTSTFPIEEQEHKSTIAVKKLKEDNVKEVKTIDDHSTTMVPDDPCLWQEENQEFNAPNQGIKSNKDQQRDSSSATCQGEGRVLDAVFKLECQEDKDEIKNVSSLSESEQMTEMTRPSKEDSDFKSETTDLKTEEYQKTDEGSQIIDFEVPNEKIKAEMEGFKGQVEHDLDAEEISRDKTEEILKTTTNGTQNEELFGESKDPGTSEGMEERMKTEDQFVVDSGRISMKDETDIERFPDEHERKSDETTIKLNLENQNCEMISGNSTGKAILTYEESGIAEISEEGTMTNREASEINPDNEQQVQSSHSTAQRQIEEENLNENTETVISTRNEDVSPMLNEPNAATLELNATEFDHEAKSIEYGGKQTSDLSEKTTEESTTIDSGKISLSHLLQRSKKETLQVDGHLTEQEESTVSQEEMKTQVAETVSVEEPKTEDEDGEEHEKTDQTDPGSDAPVMVEASRDIDVKTAHKKSHGILSGVGSKVKHSISKVKKVITGKSSHPKTLSPK